MASSEKAKITRLKQKGQLLLMENGGLFECFSPAPGLKRSMLLPVLQRRKLLPKLLLLRLSLRLRLPRNK
jgi:hypothetical protein